MKSVTPALIALLALATVGYGYAVPTDGLVAHWEGENAPASGDWVDSVGALAAGGNAVPAEGVGYTFDGTQNLAWTADLDTRNATDNFAYGVRFTATGSSGQHALLGNQVASWNVLQIEYVNHAMSWDVYGSAGGGNIFRTADDDKTIAVPEELEDDMVVSLVWMADSPDAETGTATLWKNGGLEGTETGVPRPGRDYQKHAEVQHIGNHDETNYFVGTISDVMIYKDSTLSAQALAEGMVPEPATVTLVAMGGLLAVLRRRR